MNTASNALKALRDGNGFADKNGAARGDDHAKLPLAGLFLVKDGKRLTVQYGDVRGCELWEDDKCLEFVWNRLERLGPAHWQRLPYAVSIRHDSLDELRQAHEMVTLTRERYFREEDGFTIEIEQCTIKGYEDQQE